MVDVPTLIWLLLLAFACNDGEELLTMEAWVRKHRGKPGAAIEARLVNWDKSFTAQFAVAVAVVGAIALTACWAGARTFAATGKLDGLYLAVLAVMFADGVKHVLISVVLREYSSGAVSAALAEIPYTVCAFHRFLNAGLATWGEIAWHGAVGVALAPLVLLLGFALGRLVVPLRKA